MESIISKPELTVVTNNNYDVSLIAALIKDNELIKHIPLEFNMAHFNIEMNGGLYAFVFDELTKGKIVCLDNIDQLASDYGYNFNAYNCSGNLYHYIAKAINELPASGEKSIAMYTDGIYKAYYDKQEKIVFDNAANGNATDKQMARDFGLYKKLSEQTKLKQKTEKSEVPSDIREINGVLGEIAKIHNETSIIPQPDFAISTALAFASVCCGQKLITPTNNHAVLLILNTGVTGCGKEHSYTVLERVINLLGVDANIEHGIASERAIYEALQDNANTILLFDEVWKLLAQANAGKGSAGQGALAAIMSLYSKAGVESIKPPRRASVDDKAIQYPALTMLGSSTIEKLGVTMESIQSVDGFTNRLLIIDVPYSKDLDGKRLLSRPAMNNLISESLSLKELISFFNNIDASKPVKVIFSDCGKKKYLKAINEYNNIKRSMSNEGQALFQRSIDNALKVASLLAVSVGDHTKPIITGDVMRWAWRYVSYWSKHAAKRFEFDVFDNETEKARKSVIKVLSKKNNSFGLTSSKIKSLSRPFQALPVRTQDYLLAQMANDGEINIAIYQGVKPARYTVIN